MQTLPLSVVTQTTTDEVTSWPMVRDLIRSNPNGYSARRLRGMDWGGDFRSEFRSDRSTYDKVYENFTYVSTNVGSNYYFRGVQGPRLDLLSNAEGKLGPVISEADVSNLIGLGSTAISRTLPTSPASNASNFAGELLRDGIPSMVGKNLLMNKAHFFKELGGEYLNVEFGWKPFVSDLRKFAHAVKHSDKILRQYERDSGKLIRRRYRFPQVRTAGILYAPRNIQVQGLQQSALYADNTGYGMQYGEYEYTKDYWFSGAYTYYLSRDTNHREKMERLVQEADKLLGTRITPEVLWNLMPWSWAADWIGNFGSVLQNLTAFSNDGMVMKYGYVMGDLHLTHTHTTSGAKWKNGTASGKAQRQIVSRYKLRQHATPFGFGLDPATDFTARQWSIIAALGLTHGHRVSW